jgi:hypothetical protein
MIYDKALVASKQQAAIKSITELLNTLSDINPDSDGSGNTIIGDDGSVMTLGIENNRGNDGKPVQIISITIKKLNQASNVIRLVKRKPEKTIVVLKKKDTNE